MTLWMLVLCLALFPQDSGSAGQQPATQPAEDSGSSLRKPRQAEVLERLLRDREAPTPILPVPPERRVDLGSERDGAGDSDTLLTEGVMLTQRSGRLLRESDASYFEFDAVATVRGARRIKILETQLLEHMENLAASGTTTFRVTAEVMRYRGQNRLLLKMVVPEVSHGNLSP